MNWHGDRQASCTDVTQVQTHFRIPIPSGQSTFTVPVPHHHLHDTRRRFFFNQLHLTPDFYSLEADRLNLDADPELDKVLQHQLRIKINYADVKLVYGSTMENTTTTKTSEVLAKMNRHFEGQKPVYAHTTPFFIDWIDTGMEPQDPFADYVPELASLYYGTDFNAIKHKNSLPESVQGLEGVNDFYPPVDGNMADDDMYKERIRLRVWMAPYTKAIFSNVQAFVTDLGFAQDQMGELVGRQYHLTNNTAFYQPMAVAQAAPSLALSVPKFKVTLQPSSPLIINRVNVLSLTQRDWLDNDKLIQGLADVIKEASLAINIVLSVSFDKNQKIFQFNFPASENVNVQVVCEPDFAHRLGFGFQTILSKGMQAQEQKDRNSNNQDPQKKAASVVFDTGPIVCTLDHVSSNTTSGSLYQTMTALYPRSSGTLSMPHVMCPCSMASSPNAVPLGMYQHSGTGDKSHISFRLLRIYDNQTISEFAWKCNAYIYGVLQGVCPAADGVHQNL